jgi:KaiC/GvpD/RAD55 family RecA-like ATPase
MDDIPGRFPADSLSPRTHLLGVSPPMLGLERLADQYIARGLETGDGCIIVTTNRGAKSAVESVAGLSTGTEAELARLGIVDATGRNSGDESLPCRLESVSSPADLTGIGIGLDKLLESLYGMDVGGYRVLIDSISSFRVYAGFDRVFQFLHTVTNQIDKIDGTSVSLLSADADRTQFSRFESLFDGVIEARTADGGPEYRVRGHDGPGDWRSLDTDARPESDASDSSLVSESNGDGTRTRGTPGPRLESPTSLRAIIDAVDSRGLTLTLCNCGESDDVREALREYFERHNVSVRTATLSTDTPANVALLHRESDVFATSEISELHAAISLDGLEGDGDLTAVVRPDVLEHVHRDEYRIENGTKLEMVRISRLIEMRALETGRGTLHAGFQRLNRLDDELGTRELYEAIARAGVTVHLYGRPGAIPNDELYTLHAADAGELVESWFVVYDGAGEDARKAAEVCRETRPERYTGFWTHQSRIVDETASYLEAAYGGA